MRPVEIDVLVTGPGDVAGSESGGAAQLTLARNGHRHLGVLTPELDTAAAVLEQARVPVSVVLRLGEDVTTTGGELTRLHGLIEHFARLGAAGFTFAFLNTDWQIDIGVMRSLAQDVHDRGLRVTVDRGIDQVLDADRAWALVRELPGLDGIRTAGSARGIDHGMDSILMRLKADPSLSEVVVVESGASAEHVPWLTRAGIHRFAIASAARPQASWKAYVDADHVRAWRLLVDDSLRTATSTWTKR